VFDVGFTEILLIGIVSLVVIGPERLPAVAKTAGQWVGKLQRFVRGVKTDLASELESGDLKKLIGDQREQINELKNMVHSAKKDFETSTRDAVQGAKKSLGELETSVKELDADTASTEGSTNGSMNGRGEPDQTHDAVANDTEQTTSAPTTPPDETGGQQTPTLRAESSAPADDSANVNRTGTDSGS